MKASHVKERLLGHWGSSPGLSFTYGSTLNRMINKYDLEAISVANPGTARRACSRLSISRAPTQRFIRKRAKTRRDAEIFKGARFQGRMGSHGTPETPGSIHEGGEFGYGLTHACGGALDNPI